MKGIKSSNDFMKTFTWFDAFSIVSSASMKTNETAENFFIGWCGF